MFHQTTPEVLVAGAGPVGLFAALALTKRGIPTQIADRGWRAGTHSYALALHPASLSLLHDAGLLESVMEKAYPVRRIALYDVVEKRASIDLEPFAGSWSCLAVLKQDVLEDLLAEKLSELGVPILWSHEVFGLENHGDHVAARIDKFEKDSVGYAVARTEWVLAKTINTDVNFVIGADGHRSRVRRTLRLDFPEVAPAQHYAVFEFHTDADLQNELRIVLGDQTTDVLWPLPGGYCRWSFELPQYTDAGEGHDAGERQKDRLFNSTGPAFPELTEWNLMSLIAKRAPWFTGSVGEITWRNVVRFEKRLTSAFGTGRMWLAGDSAHLAGPIGVQSMNVGLSEAAQLVDIIAGGGSSFVDYEGRWSAEWRRLLSIGGGLEAGPKADPWIAKHAAGLMSCLPGFGEDLDRLAGQLGLTYPLSHVAGETS